MPAPEEVRLDAENIGEDSRSPAETERCPEPRTAKRRRRTRRTRVIEGGAHMAGWRLAWRLLWGTRPELDRARHKAIESWKLEA